MGKIYYLLLDKTGCFLILLLCALVFLCPQFQFLFLCNVRVVQKRTLLYNGIILCTQTSRAQVIEE